MARGHPRIQFPHVTVEVTGHSHALQLYKVDITVPQDLETGSMVFQHPTCLHKVDSAKT